MLARRAAGAPPPLGLAVSAAAARRGGAGPATGWSTRCVVAGRQLPPRWVSCAGRARQLRPAVEAVEQSWLDDHADEIRGGIAAHHADKP
ncbi:MAG: hypothetical protein U5N53_07605 [Mycobacterium sp.]|nr:hypothetical protein [Mycobacterium sp.]